MALHSSRRLLASALLTASLAAALPVLGGAVSLKSADGAFSLDLPAGWVGQAPKNKSQVLKARRTGSSLDVRKMEAAVDDAQLGPFTTQLGEKSGLKITGDVETLHLGMVQHLTYVPVEAEGKRMVTGLFNLKGRTYFWLAAGMSKGEFKGLVESLSRAAEGYEPPPESTQKSGGWIALKDYGLKFPVPEGLSASIPATGGTIVMTPDQGRGRLSIGATPRLAQDEASLAAFVASEQANRALSMTQTDAEIGAQSNCTEAKGRKRRLANGWPSFQNSFSCAPAGMPRREYAMVVFTFGGRSFYARGSDIPLERVSEILGRATGGEAPPQRPSARKAARSGGAVQENAKNLFVLRSATNIYYGNHQGENPARLRDLISPDLPAIPVLRVGGHPEGSGIQDYDGRICLGKDIDRSKLLDTGHWGYVSDPDASCAGEIFIDCSHRDPKGRRWNSY